MFKYTLDNKRYYTLNYYYKKKYNSKVFKVSLNAGFGCPNKKNGSGCIYCYNGSGDNRGMDIIEQFNKVRDIVNKKWPNSKYIGYFQADTNTYAPLSILKENYEKILSLPNVIGLNIATRCDALDSDILDYLEDKFIIFNACTGDVVVHVINGLPFETKDMMLETIKYVSKLDIQGIKIHMLFIIKGTLLENLYNKERFHVLTRDEYVDIVCDELELLREDIVINRITGDPLKELVVEPKWLLKKFCVLNEIDKEMVRRDSYQGKKYV